VVDGKQPNIHACVAQQLTLFDQIDICLDLLGELGMSLLTKLAYVQTHHHRH
jgi:hypothetical protein